MKRPIEPSEIRKGDLIRVEFSGMPGSASEWIAEVEGVSPYAARSGQHYLLDHGAPSATLPSKPTLGVLEWVSGPNTNTPGVRRRMFAEWYPSPCISGFGGGNAPTQMHASGTGLQVPMTAVVAWTPSTAVPTEALDELRRRGANLAAQEHKPGQSIDRSIARLETVESIRTFLAAVDEANGGAA